MIDTDKYEGHTSAPWNIIMPTMAYDNIKIVFDTISYDEYTRPVYDWITIASLLPSQKRNAQLIADAPLLLEFIQKIVKEWNVPNKCNQEFGKDVRQLMYEYGLITFNEETRRYEVKGDEEE